MKIVNKTRTTVIDENAKEVRSFFARMKGLMFTKKPQTLVLVAQSQSVSNTSIHMWFMRQAIDVIWLDREFKVVGLYENAKPWAFKLFKPKVAAKYVVECPVGTIKKSKTKEGDGFSFSKD